MPHSPGSAPLSWRIRPRAAARVPLVLGQGCTDLTELTLQLVDRALVVMPVVLLGVVEVVVVALVGVVAAVVVAGLGVLVVMMVAHRAPPFSCAIRKSRHPATSAHVSWSGWRAQHGSSRCPVRPQ